MSKTKFEIQQAPDLPLVWPENSPPPVGRFITDVRICFGIIFFENKKDAAKCEKEVKRKGLTVNGGYSHGMPCGRATQFDFDDDEDVAWHAVTF